MENESIIPPAQDTMRIVKVDVEKLASPSSLEIYYSGPPPSDGPLPAFFYFALSGEESLALDPFNQPIAYLQGQQLRCFSFTLPKHGPEFIKSEAMHAWAHALLSGEDLFQSFFDQVDQTIDFLIQQNLVDPNKMVVGGLSRGGFIATHLAARRQDFKAILGFAPLTDISFLSEFKQTEIPLVQKWTLENQIPRLTNQHLRFYIGNDDQRVGTEKCFAFLNRIVHEAVKNKIRSPQVEFLTFPSIGHKGHGTPPDIFYRGVRWLISKILTLESPNQQV